MGSLIFESRDASGLYYRRNRYYDSEKGRFTQEDPIGLAGGINVYGFAYGDPVTYSDSDGLCPNGVAADSVRSEGRTTTLYCRDGTTETRSGGSPAWRNYNPGNLEASTPTLQAGSAGRFAIFANRADGDAAHLRQLQLDAARGFTLEELLYKYAPPIENDTERYIAVATTGTGILRTTRLTSLSGAQMLALMRVMQQHEGWIPGTVTIRPTHPFCRGDVCFDP
jgi:RHS repeat-associated protein